MSSSNKTLVGNHNSSSRGMLAIIWLLILYGVSLLVFFAEFREEDSFAYFVTVLVGIGFAPVIGYQYLRGGRWKDKILMHPPLQISAWIIVMFVVPGMVGIYDRTFFGRYSHLFVITDVEIVKGWSIVLQGLLCMWIGYIISQTFVERHSKRNELFGKSSDLQNSSHRFSQQVIFILYFILLGIAFIDISISGVSYGTDKSAYGAFVIFAGTLHYLTQARRIFLMILIYNSQKGQRNVVTAILLVFEVLFSVSSGFTKPLLWTFIMSGLTLYVAGVTFRRYAFSSILLLILFFVLGIYTTAITERLRYYINVNAVDTRSLNNVVDVIFDAYDDTWGQGFDVGWKVATDKLVLRQVVVSWMPAVIVQKTPSVLPFEGFNRFFEIPAYFLPRFIWQDKPILPRGVWFSIAYLNHPSETRTANAITPYGENYMYAGVVGVAFGQFVFGIILSLIFGRFRNYGSGLILVVLLPTYIDFDNQYTVILASLIQGLFVNGLFYVVALTLSRSKDTRNELNNSTKSRLFS